ncbi:MAG: hypothetical protein ACYC9L_11560 [Sulfuricaulis sp.]
MRSDLKKLLLDLASAPYRRTGRFNYWARGKLAADLILDALYYIPYAEQDLLLDRIRAALRSGGLFVTRVGDAGAGLRFFLSQIVDRVIFFTQGHRLARMWCRPLPAWISVLRAKGFAVEAQPVSAGTPFANFMLEASVL